MRLQHTEGARSWYSPELVGRDGKRSNATLRCWTSSIVCYILKKIASMCKAIYEEL